MPSKPGPNQIEMKGADSKQNRTSPRLHHFGQFLSAHRAIRTSIILMAALVVWSSSSLWIDLGKAEDSFLTDRQWIYGIGLFILSFSNIMIYQHTIVRTLLASQVDPNAALKNGKSLFFVPCVGPLKILYELQKSSAILKEFGIKPSIWRIPRSEILAIKAELSSQE